MAADKEKVLEIAKKIYSDIETYEHRNQIALLVPKDKLVELCQELRDNEETSFDMCLDITAIDWATKQNRFETVYFLYSNRNKARIRLRVKLDGEYPTCPSVTSIWRSANWYERETFDMYGIKFEGHPFLRRFYMPEDFADPDSGEPLYPLRKDFPLMGIPDSLPLPPYPEKHGGDWDISDEN